ncbi:hypothetical protein [Bradyrhizobium centrosematis]|uniref:hypothetical protein n=1 Tax=Bradyrhizobium centrosematis TaxID=1300039 RepID=UPI002166D16B|nr:hypothetical protein [Bradyrhizobium centrosematis]MCS3763028.1 hypothetical protein [Bradyrhizobium centrosematis]MCS3775695.1 hypothetical protein [Bradyrhizobium centrosematis]
MSSLPTRLISWAKYGSHFFLVDAAGLRALTKSAHNASNFIAGFGGSNFGKRSVICVSGV